MRRCEPWRVHGPQPGVGASGFAVVSVCLFGAMWVGCSSVVVPAGEPVLQDGCVIATPSSADVLDVGIARTVDPAHAPVARHAGERLVFRQLYDTLVRVDCTGALVPGVAESWGSEDGGRTWTFRLRPDARFWDGAPVAAREVIEGWAAASGAPSMAWVSAVGERELRVALSVSAADARVFSDPALAVVRHESGEEWPVGTGGYRPAPGTEDLLRIVRVAPSNGGAPPVVFHV
ncbi:MAG: ABC transporter substrate-binding protein, partial [Longimicrobiales bacterium]